MAAPRSGSRKQFSLLRARIPLLMAGGVFALLGLSGIMASSVSTGDRVFGAVFLLPVGIWFGYRGWRSSVVTVTADRLVLCSFLRTRRLPLDQVSRASVGVGNTGPTGWGRQYLVVEMRDGSEVVLKELNAKPRRRPGPPTVVERCVAAINEVVSPPPQASGP